MSKLTLDEAIKHCLEVAERYETRAKMIDRRKLGFALENPTACHECAADHRQLAEWLTELKETKRLLKQVCCDFSNDKAVRLDHLNEALQFLKDDDME